MRRKVAPSSVFIALNTSQDIHDACFIAKSPWTLPPQNVPATAQHILPPFLPLFAPLHEVSVAAGHTPNSAVFYRRLLARNPLIPNNFFLPFPSLQFNLYIYIYIGKKMRNIRPLSRKIKIRLKTL